MEIMSWMPPRNVEGRRFISGDEWGWVLLLVREGVLIRDQLKE